VRSDAFGPVRGHLLPATISAAVRLARVVIVIFQAQHRDTISGPHVMSCGRDQVSYIWCQYYASVAWHPHHAHALSCVDKMKLCAYKGIVLFEVSSLCFCCCSCSSIPQPHAPLHHKYSVCARSVCFEWLRPLVLSRASTQEGSLFCVALRFTPRPWTWKANQDHHIAAGLVADLSLLFRTTYGNAKELTGTQMAKRTYICASIINECTI